MGDRANIIVDSGRTGRVCLYTHWNGTELPNVLRAALKRGKGRWSDAQYLARIIFCEMVKDDVLGLTGFGISQGLWDGRDKVITVYVTEQKIRINDRPPVSFEDFINLPDDSITW